MTRDEFIAAARAVQPKEYDYSTLGDNVVKRHKLAIRCPEHGMFYQRADHHLDGRIGCRDCRRAIASEKRTVPFIAKATAYHKGKYDYSKVQYVDLDTPVEIICPTHGSFMHTPTNHLKHGCPKCAANATVDFDEFVARSRAVHGDRYVYHREAYKGVSPKTRITCPVHGDFEQAPFKHYGGQGCGKCYVHRAAFSFLDDAAAVHGTKYRYLDEYKGYYVPIRIECPEHGEFSQTPSNHLQGACPATVCVGLYHMGDLVMVATFGKPRFNKDYQWELLRLCSVLNTTVVGGASKLLKHFMRDHTGSILSYANRRWSDGKVYEQLGFTLVRETEPSYVWFDGVRVWSRYQCQKSKLHKLLGDKYDPAKSERENMIACGYTRVWDCGNLVYGLSND